MNIGTLTGHIQLDDQLTPKLMLAGQKAAEVSAKFTRTGMALSLGITAPLVAAASASLLFSGKFESSMTRLVSTAGVAQHEIEGVKQHILALAPATGIGPQALADAMMKVSSTVADTKVALEILDIAAQGTKAGFGETVDIAGALTSVLNSYGAENLSAARAADILAIAVKEGGAEAKELAPTLANVVPFASQLGVSFEEVAANIATMTKLGVPTTEAVNSLTSVFSALSKETKQGSEALAGMGTSYGEIREQIRERGLAATLQDLTEKFGGNVTAMTDVFGRIEAVKNVMGTAGVQGETYSAVLDAVKRSSEGADGAMTDMANAMSGKQVQTWAELTVRVQVLAIRLGDELAPAFAAVMDAVVPLLDAVAGAFERFDKLPKPIQLVSFGLIALVAAAGPALMMIGSMARGVAVLLPLLVTLTGALTSTTVAMYGLSTGAVWSSAVLGTGGLTKSLRFLIDQTSIFGLRVGVASAGTVLWGQTLGPLLAGIKVVGVAIGAFFLSPVGLAVAAIGLLVGGLRLLTGSWEFVLTPMRAGWRLLKDVWAIVRDLASEIGTALKPVLEDIGAVFQEIGTTIRTVFAGALKDARIEAQSLWEFLKQTVGPLRDLIFVLNLVHARAEGIRGAEKKVKDQASQDFWDNARRGIGPLNVPSAAPALGAPGALRGSYVPSPYVPPTPSLTEAGESAATALAEVNKEIQQLRAGSRGLTDVNKASIVSLTTLGLSADKVAIKLGLSSVAVLAYLDDRKKADDAATEASDNALRYASFEHELVEQQLRDSQRRSAEELQANAIISASQHSLNEQAADYAQKNKERLLTGTALELEKLRVVKSKAIADLGERTDANASYWDKAKTELDKYFEAEEAGLIKSKTAWDKTYDALGDVSAILDHIPGKFAEIAVMAARTGRAIMENLAEGDWIGAAVSAATFVVTAFNKMVGWANEGRKAIVAFADSFDTIAEGTGFDELQMKLEALGATGRQMWIDLTQRVGKGDLEGAEREIKKIQAALAALDSDIQKYNLTWKDMANAQDGATRAGLVLADSWRRLVAAGYTLDAITRGMSNDLNQYIIDTMKAGTKIPAYLAPAIKKLIEMKLISAEAAAAMLGLADSSIPSLADIKAAADRYGITLDELGPKVKQLEITELANQYVADWKTLTATTDDWAVLFEKMGPKVQDLVTDAIKYGSELPAAMKPMIQAFIDAGLLVDENGVALTDLSQLTFAADLSAMFESLILKLDELIDKIGTGVGGALEDIGRRVVRPRIIPELDYDGTTTEYDDPSYHATGGIVKPAYYAPGGNVVAFTPRGTDTVPAMLTPGERVLTVAQNRDYEQRQTGQRPEQPIQITLVLPDGDVLLRQTVLAGKRRGYI